MKSLLTTNLHWELKITKYKLKIIKVVRYIPIIKITIP